MKIHFHTFATAALMALSLTYTLSAQQDRSTGMATGNIAAQDQIPRVTLSPSIPESTIKEDRQLGAVPFMPCSPVPKTLMLGRNDNFSPQPDPLFVSPTANAVWGNKLVPFDFSGINRVFAASINLGQCKWCGRNVSVELRVQRKKVNDDSGNDRAYLHLSDGAPNQAGLSTAVDVKDIWKDTPTLLVKTVTMQVSVAQINAHIFQKPQAFLDIVVQDDTAVDFVKITW